MAALVKKLMHICLTVPNLDEGLKFYRDVLGFETVFKTENDKADGLLLGFDAEKIGLKAHHVVTVGAQHDQATEINIVEFTNPRPATDESPYGQMNHVGLTRLALLVESVDEAYVRIESYTGVEIVCEPKEIVIIEPERSFTAKWFSFKDPFGVFITINEPPQP